MVKKLIGFAVVIGGGYYLIKTIFPNAFGASPAVRPSMPGKNGGTIGALTNAISSIANLIKPDPTDFNSKGYDPNKDPSLTWTDIPDPNASGTVADVSEELKNYQANSPGSSIEDFLDGN